MDVRLSVLQRAKAVEKRSGVFVGSGEYIQGFRNMPSRFVDYEQEAEPVIDISDIISGNSSEMTLSVNRYNAVVLNSPNMFIADIDFGDPRLNQFAGAEDCDDVLRNLSELSLLDDHLKREDICLDETLERQDLSFEFCKQSYRVYRTHSGCRVICTSRPFPFSSDSYLATKLLRFLRSDPQYVALCLQQKSYRARLTPKPWRNLGDGPDVCELYGAEGEGVLHPQLAEQLRVHDAMTLPSHARTSFSLA